VVSLVPSVTETLLDWGVDPVAVTRFCEAPGVPTVGGTKNPDIPAIVGMAPDLVVMDREENRAPDAQELEEAGVRVLATHVTSVESVEPTLALLAEALELSPPAPTGPDKTEPGLTEPAPTEPGPPEPGPRPRVWVPIWRRPWMTIGSGIYGTSLLKSAGFENVYADSAEAYPEIEVSEAARRSPDYVLAPSEPYKFGERHREELASVAPVVFVDGQDLFWWGARTPAAWQRLRNLAAELARRQDSN